MQDDLAWETLEAETVYACEAFDVVRERVRLPDGTEAAYDHLREGESVVILPVTADGDVVVIEEWRQAVDRVNRGLPAGVMEPEDDSPADAARRELREETGYEAGALDHLTSVEPANGLLDSVFHYYLARDCEPTAEQDLDDNETIRVDRTSKGALREAALAGELRDGRSALAVLHAEATGAW